MPDYGACYNSTGSRCSGKPQPGTVALQLGVQDVFPTIGSYGIYNCRPSSAGGGLSTHGEGRGWDAACNANTHRRVGDDLADRLIRNYRKLGVQRIIWNRRQTDVRNGMGNWRGYGGPSPHTDHLHIELCWASARDNPLTRQYVRSVVGGEEDWFDMATKQELEAVIEAKIRPIREALDEMRIGLFAVDNDDVKEAVGRSTGSVINNAYKAHGYAKQAAGGQMGLPEDDGSEQEDG